MIALTERQRRLLVWIARRGPVGPQDVAKRFDLSASTAAVHLYNLRKLGMLQPVEVDGRTRWASLSYEEPVRASTRAINTRLTQATSVWHFAARWAA